MATTRSSSSKKKMISAREVGAELARLNPRASKVETRPALTPESRNVDVTNLPALVRENISRSHGIEGQTRQALADQSIREGVQRDIEQQQLQQRIEETAPITENLREIGQQPTQQPTQQPSQVVNGVAQGFAPNTVPFVREDTASLPPSLTPLIGADEVASIPFSAASAGSAGVTAAGVATAIGASAGLATGVGTLAGAAVLVTKFSLEKRENVAAAKTNFFAARKNINKIIADVNKGIMSPEEALILYNNQIETIETSYDNIKGETINSFRRMLSGGRTEMTEIQSFKDNEQAILRNRLINAIQKPDPNAISSETELAEP